MQFDDSEKIMKGCRYDIDAGRVLCVNKQQVADMQDMQQVAYNVGRQLE